MPPRVLAKLRKLALALPEAHEVEAWGSPTFRVKNKLFAMYASANDHHGGGRNGVFLDSGTDWPELAELLADGWRMTAPKRLVKTYQSVGT